MSSDFKPIACTTCVTYNKGWLFIRSVVTVATTLNTDWNRRTHGRFWWCGPWIYFSIPVYLFSLPYPIHTGNDVGPWIYLCTPVYPFSLPYPIHSGYRVGTWIYFSIPVNPFLVSLSFHTGHGVGPWIYLVYRISILVALSYPHRFGIWIYLCISYFLPCFLILSIPVRSKNCKPSRDTCPLIPCAYWAQKKIAMEYEARK